VPGRLTTGCTGGGLAIFGSCVSSSSRIIIASDVKSLEHGYLIQENGEQGIEGVVEGDDKPGRGCGKRKWGGTLKGG
jgi:hypothetical protein